MNNEQELGIEKYQLEPETSKTLTELYKPFLEQANQWKNDAQAIIVTDANQTILMAKAREMRLKLKNIRGEVEKTRKKLKEDIIKNGKAIDGVSNMLKGLIEPIEEHLQKQEDYIKIKKELAEAKIKSDRTAELSPYLATCNSFPLGTMPDAEYKELLETSKTLTQKRKDDEAEAETLRQKKIKDDAADRQRIIDENEQLKKDNEKKDDEIEKNRVANNFIATQLNEKAAEVQELKQKVETAVRAPSLTEEKFLNTGSIAQSAMAKNIQNRQHIQEWLLTLDKKWEIMPGRIFSLNETVLLIEEFVKTHFES